MSALKVYASVNNLPVIHVSGRFMNFWMEPVLSRILALVSIDQVTLQILLLVILAICSLNYLSNEKSLGKYIPPPDSAKTQHYWTFVDVDVKLKKRTKKTEGSVFEFQPATVSAITSSAKNPISTVQISIRVMTSIWAGPHQHWHSGLPGCYKGNINKAREACSVFPEALNSWDPITLT